jgi:hypothetical protein
MSESGDPLDLPEQTRRRIRERVLQAEKEKLNLRNPIGVRQDIEQIFREEID